MIVVPRSLKLQVGLLNSHLRRTVALHTLPSYTYTYSCTHILTYMNPEITATATAPTCFMGVVRFWHWGARKTHEAGGSKSGPGTCDLALTSSRGGSNFTCLSRGHDCTRPWMALLVYEQVARQAEPEHICQIPLIPLINQARTIGSRILVQLFGIFICVRVFGPTLRESAGVLQLVVGSTRGDTNPSGDRFRWWWRWPCAR